MPSALPSAKPYIVAQANLQRSNQATKDIIRCAAEEKLAFALLQEPYVGVIGRMSDYRGVRIYQYTGTDNETVKAAIAVFDADIDVIFYPEWTTHNIVVAKLRTRAWEVVVVSFYFEPHPSTMEQLGKYLEQLKQIERKFGKYIIVGGDANAKSTWWGNKVEDNRGELTSGALEEMELQVLNNGDIPTYDCVRGNKLFSSSVDVTACTTELLSLIDGWMVREDMTCSDHNTIIFNLHLKKSKGINIKRTTRIYNSKKANWAHFHEKLDQLLLENNMTISKIQEITYITQLDVKINEYINIIIQACNSSMAKIKSKITLTLPPWWSEQLAALKKKATVRKRRIRCAAPVRREAVVEEYLKAKKEYLLAVQNAEVESWKAFCERQDKEGMWESIYRVIGRTAKRQEDLLLVSQGKTLDPKESAELLAATFYPEDKEEEDNPEHQQIRIAAEQVNCCVHDEIHDPQFTSVELEAAIKSFNPKKAPGSDGLTVDICQHAIERDRELFLSLANKCLELSHFPNAWKEATVVVLRKPGKANYMDPKSYRPIGLLPVMGKVLEKMVVARVKWYVLPKLSPCQFGFMPQRSTEDSLYVLLRYIREKLKQKKIITMISLDIEGAFDSAWWPALRVRLAEVNCPVNIRRIMDSYLRDRKVRVRYAGEESQKNTSKGCVQGSIGGPILWNLLLDPLLQQIKQRGEYCQAFADDVVLIFDGDTGLEVQRRANAALDCVRQWGVKNKLRFAPHKTNAMVMTRKLKYDTPLLTMGGIEIGMSREIKILGVTIDDQLTFNSHVRNACAKAINVYKQLSRAAKISWGLHPEIIRTIYVAVIEPIILYAASVWAPAVEKLGIQKQLGVVQRGFAQKLCKAYRTVSLHAAIVLAGILPLDLRVQEAAALYEAKRGIPRPELGDREVERMETYASTPHPAEHMALQFTCLEDQEQVDAHNDQLIKIYTDGSKIDGGVGAALSLWNDVAETKTKKLKLPSYCSVYQAELLAISTATKEILRRKEISFGIYSDSRSSLEAVTNYGSVHPLAVETRKNLRAIKYQNKDVSLFWVKAHAGLQGNERADQLAKEAAQRLKTKPDYDLCPISFVKSLIRRETVDKWNRRYKLGNTAETTKLFLPDAATAYKVVRKIKPDSILTQILTGHGGFSGYLNRFRLKDDPRCVCEPDKVETVAHILFECPVNIVDRYNLEQKIEKKIKVEDASELLANIETRNHFIKYCIKTAEKSIKRNKTKDI